MAAGSEIGALFVRIGADVSGLKSGLNSAEKDAAGFTSRVNTGLLKGMAILATIGASIGAIAVGAYMKTEALGQSAFDMGEKFGISGGEASKWLSIAGQLGISSETIGTGLKFISKNMGNVQLALSHGHKPALLLTDAFSSLGVKLYDANGKLRSTTDVMNQVADKFATMPDGAMKTAAAVAIFGRSGSEMIPILNQGSAGLAAMTAQGIKLGTVMSTQQVEAIHKAYLAHQKFDQALAGLTNQIGIKLMPTMTKLFNYVVTTGIPAVEKFTGWIQTLGPQLKTASDTIKALAPYIAVLAGAWVVWNVALAVTKAIEMGILAVQFAAGIIAIVSKVGLWTAAQWLLNIAMDANPIGLIILGIALLAAGFIFAYTHSTPFRNFINSLWTDLKAFASWLWTVLQPVIKGIGDMFSGIGSGIQGIASAAHSMHIPGFALGGVVPGAIGAPMLAVVHGGERVSTPAQQAAGAGGNTYNLTLVGGGAVNDPEGVRRMLTRLEFLGTA